MAVSGTSGPGSVDDERIRELYRTASQEEPAPRVDAAMRSAAHSSRHRPQRAAGARWWLPWRAPFAVAAVAVVSVTLAMLMHEEQPEIVAPAPKPEARMPPAASPEAPETRSEASDTRGRVTPPAPQAARPAPPPQSASEARGSAAAGRRTEAAPAADALAKSARDRDIATSDAATPQAPGRAPQERAIARSDNEAPAPQAAPKAEISSTAGVRGLSAEPAERRAPATAARAEGKSLNITALTASLDREPPARWLERIASLRREERNAEAEALLAEFRRRFPDEPVPRSLE